MEGLAARHHRPGDARQLVGERHARKEGSALKDWARALMERKPFKVAAVALANKLARIAWAVMARGEAFHGVRIQTA